MRQERYRQIENYMLSCMRDSAHDCQHVYRVLYGALEIARCEAQPDMDVLIAACLLHDVGREEQFANPELDHAEVGAVKAERFLRSLGCSDSFCAHVRDCIRTHRFRSDCPPETLEAKILFDADKLDVTGAMGIARTLVYKGAVRDPLYTVDADGTVLDGSGSGEVPSFFGEYQFKLKNLYGRFYTARGAELAAERQAAADSFYENLLREVRASYQNGTYLLREQLER